MLIPIDEVVHFDIATHRADTGAVTDADATPTFDVFEESTDTPILDDQNFTKRTSLTGNYRGSFTASAANGFEAGKWYSVVASATVNSVAAKAVALHFRVAPAESAAGVPKGDVSHFGGTAGTFASGRPETNATHWAGTAVGSANVLIDGAITAAKIATDAIDADALADGAITAATFAAGAIDAAAIAADAIGSSELAASAITEIQSGLSTLTAAQVNAEVDTALADVRLDELLAADSDIDGAAPPTVGSVFHELLSKTAGSFTFDQTTDSLEAIRDKETDLETDTQDIQARLPAALVSGRIDASVGAMAANVVTAASIASDAITDAKVASDVTIASVTGAVGSVTGAVGSVATGGITSASFAAGAIDAAAIAADAIGASELAASAASEIASAVRTELATELARVDAAVTTRASQTSVDTVDDFLDTEVAAIKAKTDQLTFTVANTVDANIGAVNGSATGVDKLAAHLPAILKVVLTSGSTTTTLVLNATTGIDGAAPSSVNDFYNGRVIVLTSGALAGQATDITDYDGTTKTLTVTALTGSAASGVTAVIV